MGLRGDTFLWRYIKKYYSDVKIPYEVEYLKNDILEILNKFTNQKIEKNKNFFIKEFSEKYVGMSTGIISSSFWLEVAIPLLCERLESLNNSI